MSGKNDEFDDLDSMFSEMRLARKDSEPESSKIVKESEKSGKISKNQVLKDNKSQRLDAIENILKSIESKIDAVKPVEKSKVPDKIKSHWEILYSSIKKRRRKGPLFQIVKELNEWFGEKDAI